MCVEVVDHSVSTHFILAVVYNIILYMGLRVYIRPSETRMGGVWMGLEDKQELDGHHDVYLGTYYVGLD